MRVDCRYRYLNPAWKPNDPEPLYYLRPSRTFPAAGLATHIVRRLQKGFWVQMLGYQTADLVNFQLFVLTRGAERISDVYRLSFRHPTSWVISDWIERRSHDR